MPVAPVIAPIAASMPAQRRSECPADAGAGRPPARCAVRTGLGTQQIVHVRNKLLAWLAVQSRTLADDLPIYSSYKNKAAELFYKVNHDRIRHDKFMPSPDLAPPGHF